MTHESDPKGIAPISPLHSGDSFGTQRPVVPPAHSSSNEPADPVLHELRSMLTRVYGSRLARLVLFGSRARGEARADSDYDIAVFLHAMDDRWAEFDRLNSVATDILYDRFVVVHALPYQEASYRDDPSSLMRNIREEGIDL